MKQEKKSPKKKQTKTLKNEKQKKNNYTLYKHNHTTNCD